MLQCNEPRGCMELLSIKYRVVCCANQGALKCVAVRLSVLQCVEVCYSVLKCDAVHIVTY